MPIGGERFVRRIREGLCIPLFASWCGIRKKVFVGYFNGPTGYRKGEIQIHIRIIYIQYNIIRNDPFVNNQAMVDVAKEVGADAVAHGCTGKGNDQACFKIKLSKYNIFLLHFLQQKRD